ncbi:MAG: MBL fold metallo-hydrolase [Desulfobacterales bacterium]|nr:MBL fold metallo-hydrolase [Desulfobacterales bacterium]
MNIEKIADDLFLIPLTPAITGFNDFICAWLYRGTTTCLIDVGPSASTPQLLGALRELDVNQLDTILLTHIHLDHAGAISEVAASFPMAPIICHPVAIPHLIDPTRLWQGSKKVLGSMADAYGPIKPVPAERLQAASDYQSKSIIAIITPGHAAHHVSYQTGKYLFAGETGGVFISLPNNKFYLRPATPPKFFLQDALQSIDALIDCDPQMICYGHYGVHPDAVKMLQIHYRQLQFWEQLLRKAGTRYKEPDRTAECLTKLLKEDALMASFDQLPSDVQAREKYFLQNSINGYLGFLSSEK